MYKTEFLCGTWPASGALTRTVYLAAARLLTRDMNGNECWRVDSYIVGRYVWLAPVGRGDWLRSDSYETEAAALSAYAQLLPETDPAVDYERCSEVI